MIIAKIYEEKIQKDMIQFQLVDIKIRFIIYDVYLTIILFFAKLRMFPSLMNE